MRLAKLLEYGIKELAEAGIPECQLDARLLLENCLGITRTRVFLDAQTEVDDASQQRFLGFIERRKRREPVAYILGEQEFWSLPFHVSPAVLIPRPETEFLLDRVFAMALPVNIEHGALLDLCCGSGVIATVLARETGKDVVASDVSFAALQVARKNVNRHRLAGRVQLVQGDLLSPFRRGLFSLVVANPPYVSGREIEEDLEPEVARHEPHLALAGGEDGLEIIRKMRRQLPDVLCAGGQVFMEIGADQGEAVRSMFAACCDGKPGFCDIEIMADYTGRDRVLYARNGK